jgi:hypothetical protein
MIGMHRPRPAALAAIAAAAIAAAAPAGAAKSWLDAAPLVNWNHAGAALPAAPAAANDASDFRRCAAQVRRPSTAEDRAVEAKGWRLFGAYQLFGRTSLVNGLAGVDGMCRPAEFQTFVFSGGRFAGTLSPMRMNARADGQLEILSLFSEASITAPFRRYTASDPLCCPSSVTTVEFQLTSTPNGPLLVAKSATTSKSSP